MGKQRTDIAKITKTCEKAFFLIAQLGSNWNNGTNAGSFYWNCNNSVSNRNRNISSHLLYVHKQCYTMTLRNKTLSE